MAMAPRAMLLLAVSFLAMAAAASAHGASETCTSDLLSGINFTKCLNVLDIVKVSTINEPYDKKYCCTLIAGLVDLQAALCLCKRLYLEVPVLGVDVDISLRVRLILNNCGKYCPTDFKCPSTY